MKKAQNKARRKKKSGGLYLFAKVIVALLAVLGLAIASLAAAVRILEAGLPEVPSFEEYAASVPKVSRILASDGTVIAEFFTERRTIMWPDKVPPLIEKAILAAEDADFYRHEGISFWAVARAMLVNLWRGRITQGGSTITQQVVKQVILGPQRTYERKVREMLLARLLEKKLSKKEILAIYATEVYLGRGRYGFEEAARYYFGKEAKNLNLAEAALLAGMVQAPEALNPLRNPEGALRRQHYVLKRMVEEGMVSEAEAREAARQNVEIWAREEPRLGAAGYFVDAVRREVTKMLGTESLLRDGLTIKTTLDLRIQDAAEIAVSHGLSMLYAQGRQRQKDEERAGEPGNEDGTDEMLEAIPPPPRAVRALVTACEHGRIEVKAGHVSALLEPRTLMRQVFAGSPDPFALCKKDNEVLVSRGEGQVVLAELGPQAAAVVIDPLDRAVLALVGGEDFASRPFNRAIQSRRPIGSLVKPFLYATALENGMPPDKTFPNSALVLKGAGGRPWTPRNFEGGYDGLQYDIGTAIAKSINVIAVRAMLEIGPAPVERLLRKLGFSGHVPLDLSLALGSAEASPLEVANAFATFAASGLYDTPYFVKSISDYRGRLLFEHEPRPSRVLSKGTAETIRRMMRRVVTEGTAVAASTLPGPVFGKTGTTNRSREAWFAGSDGRIVAVFLVGYDDRLPMAGATGGNTAVPMFVAFLRALRRQ